MKLKNAETIESLGLSFHYEAPRHQHHLIAACHNLKEFLFDGVPEWWAQELLEVVAESCPLLRILLLA